MSVLTKGEVANRVMELMCCVCVQPHDHDSVRLLHGKRVVGCVMDQLLWYSGYLMAIAVPYSQAPLVLVPGRHSGLGFVDDDALKLHQHLLPLHDPVLGPSRASPAQHSSINSAQELTLCCIAVVPGPDHVLRLRGL